MQNLFSGNPGCDSQFFPQCGCHGAVSIQPSEDSETPMFSVAPKERSSPLTFNQWLQGFEVLMSVHLLAPRHRPDVHAMLMYIQTVRNLAQRGADWRSYDEAFRSLQ